MSEQLERLRPRSGLRAYDAVEWRGASLPPLSHAHVGVAMSSVLQQPIAPGSRHEVQVDGVADYVLITRFGVPHAQPARIAGRPRVVHAIPGIHIGLPAGIDSWWSMDGTDRGAWFHLHFPPAAVAAAEAEHQQVLDRAFVEVDAALDALVRHARLLAEGDSAPPPLAWESLAVLVLHRLAVLARGRALGAPRSGGLAAWQARRVIDFLGDHLAQSTSLSDLAALVNLSPFHFARAFKHTVGVPPHRYQMMLRIERACEWLGRDGVTIAEVATAVGFQSTSSFARAFRQATGYSPTAFVRTRDHA